MDINMNEDIANAEVKKKRKKRNGIAVAGIVVASVSIFLYIGCIALSFLIGDMDYLKDLGLGGLFAAIFHATFMIYWVFISLVYTGVSQVVQLVLFVVGLSARRFRTKALIPSGILLFFSTAFAIVLVIATFNMFSALGL